MSRWVGGWVGVVFIGHFPAFYVVFVPLEYITNIPPHASYVIDICFVVFKKREGQQRICSQDTNYVTILNVYVVKIQIMSQCPLSPYKSLWTLSKVQKTMT